MIKSYRATWFWWGKWPIYVAKMEPQARNLKPAKEPSISCPLALCPKHNLLWSAAPGATARNWRDLFSPKIWPLSTCILSPAKKHFKVEIHFAWRPWCSVLNWLFKSHFSIDTTWHDWAKMKRSDTKNAKPQPFRLGDGWRDDPPLTGRWDCPAPRPSNRRWPNCARSSGHCHPPRPEAALRRAPAMS